MKWLAACCAIAVVLGAGAPAHARTIGLISTGDDIMLLRPLSPELSAELGYDLVGYRYHAIGVLNIDLWRWGGEVVVFRDEPGDLEGAARGTIVINAWRYQPLGDDGIAHVGGADVPWKYYFPIGLLVALALLELLFVARRRRAARMMGGLGLALLAFAGVLRAQGVDQAFAVPLMLGLHHLGAWSVARRREAVDAATDATDDANQTGDAPRPGDRHDDEAPAPRELRPAELRRERPPIIDADPFRMPPQPAPLAVQYPPAAVGAPLRVVAPEGGATDEEEPKHLR
jgi:hypothetical protein